MRYLSFPNFILGKLGLILCTLQVQAPYRVHGEACVGFCYSGDEDDK